MWLTTKDGRRVNTEWFDEDERRKYAQIEANEKQAQELMESTNAKKSNTTKEIKGDVDFATIVKASDNSLSFGKIVTVTPAHYMPESGKKKDLDTLLNKYNINDVVMHTYRDKAGANDLKRMQSLGFEVVAQYLGKQQAGSAIPPMDYYFMKRKKA